MHPFPPSSHGADGGLQLSSLFRCDKERLMPDGVGFLLKSKWSHRMLLLGQWDGVLCRGECGRRGVQSVMQYGVIDPTVRRRSATAQAIKRSSKISNQFLFREIAPASVVTVHNLSNYKNTYSICAQSKSWIGPTLFVIRNTSVVLGLTCWRSCGALINSFN